MARVFCLGAEKFRLGAVMYCHVTEKLRYMAEKFGYVAVMFRPEAEFL
jgi:hypothetical protein